MSKFGVGLRAEHYDFLEQNSETELDFFEVISETFYETEGRPKKLLLELRKDYEISCHGVSLSIASADPISQSYLKKLKAFYDQIEPMNISDHLCWTGNAHSNTHNLLPFPYTEKNLDFVASRVHHVQETLDRPLSLENLSAYLSWNESTMPEWDFLNQLAEKTGCKILLDINNIYVNSFNQRFDPKTFLDRINPECVAQMHLAGFEDKKTHYFDSHGEEVHDEVWDLYSYYLNNSKHYPAPTLLEWDTNIPSFELLENEAIKAKMLWKTIN